MSYRTYTCLASEKEKNRWITAEKSYDIFLDTVIKYDWQQKMTLSVPKIKSFFSKTPEKNQDIIQGAADDITNDDMEQMENGDNKEEEKNMEYLSLKYPWLVMVTISYFRFF